MLAENKNWPLELVFVAIQQLFSSHMIGITGHLGCKRDLALLVCSLKEKWLEQRYPT